MDIIQYLTGGNVTLQVAVMTLFSAIISILVSWWVSKEKIKTVHQDFEKKLEYDREQFEINVELQKKSFDKQCSQFESTLNSQQSTTYKELITAERIKWFNGLRNDIVDIVKYLSEINNLINKNHPVIGDNNNIFCNEILNEVSNLKIIVFSLKLKINPNEHHYIEILNNLLTLPETIVKIHKEYNMYDGNMHIFQYESQKILKSEWEKIKDEAKQLYHE